MLLFGLALFITRVASAQEIFVKNQFVAAGVFMGDGYVTIYQGDPNLGKRLTYKKFSYLTVKVGGQYFTNNDQGPGPVIPNQLVGGETFRVGDTIRTIWKENGFDIIQNAYPVAFTTSGVIVLSVSIVNHTSGPLDAQAQFLLDNENGTNDQAYLLHQYGYFRNWQDCPPKPMPSFCLAFENPPDAQDLGVTGIGYYNDTFPPRPLGLMQPSVIEYGNWAAQSLVTWGTSPGSSGQALSDDATLMMGKQWTASSFVQGSNDSVTEIFRTAYGTPEWCFRHGNMVAFALYPQHLYWDSKSNSYTPNPFKVQTFMFNVKPNTATGVTIKQNVGSPVVIKTPNPSGLQNIGSISIGGFAEAHWTDSVLISPNGCASSFPIDIHFDVTANGIGTPTFTDPWACSIQVECPHPDTLPPTFQNSYVGGCSPIPYDTAIIQENNFYDLGLQSISVSSPDLTTSQYSASPSQQTYSCILTPVKVFVHQIDTFTRGHVIIKSTDCAGNISLDTICFTAHPPLPDLTAPVFIENTTGADCHTRCTDWTITDTATSNTSLDRGIDQINVASTNMTVTGTTGKFTPSAPVATLHVCATDSMLDGTVTLQAIDTAHNSSTQTITFCTTPDAKAPLITQTPFSTQTNTWHVHVTDTTAWDRGVDSVWIEQGGNVSTIPTSLPTSLNCVPSFDFELHVDDTTRCARGTVMARDCKGNITSPFQLSFNKGAKPTITPDKLILCNPTDSVVLTANGSFRTFNWSNNASGARIVVRSAGSYTVTADDGVGCAASSDPVTIVSSPATPAVTPAGPIVLCAPDNVKLDAGAGFKSYQWWNGATKLTGANSETLLVTSTGTYSAQVTNAADCDGVSQPVSVTINPIPPQPVITSNAGVLSSTPASSYQWSLIGKDIPGATSQTYTPLTGGDYTVTITDANGCQNTSQPFSNAGATLIAVDTVSSREGAHITIPLRIVTSQSVPQGVERTWNAIIRFNKTLLVPKDPTVTSAILGNDRIVQYTGKTLATQGTLQPLAFVAALGSDSCTPITIDSFWWNTPNLYVTKQNGQFCLAELCTQGGTRFFNPDGKFTLSVARPSPAQHSVTIDYSLIESGHTTLVVSDLLGREVLRLVDAVQEPGTYTVSADIGPLSTGTYIYSLRTPTLVQSHHLQIAR